MASLDCGADGALSALQPKHKLAVYKRNIDWFRFWLQGYEDPNPAKVGQYRIWREMRDQQCKRLEGKGQPLSYCRSH